MWTCTLIQMWKYKFSSGLSLNRHFSAPLIRSHGFFSNLSVPRSCFRRPCSCLLDAVAASLSVILCCAAGWWDCCCLLPPFPGQMGRKFPKVKPFCLLSFVYLKKTLKFFKKDTFKTLFTTFKLLYRSKPFGGIINVIWRLKCMMPKYNHLFFFLHLPFFPVKTKCIQYQQRMAPTTTTTTTKTWVQLEKPIQGNNDVRSLHFRKPGSTI